MPPSRSTEPESVPMAAVVFDVVYTLLSDMAAIMGWPRGFSFRGMTFGRTSRRAHISDTGHKVPRGYSLGFP